MRIVHIVDSLEIGGAETLIAQLCRYQRARGHDVKLCCTFTGGALAEELCASGFEVAIVQAYSSLGRVASLRRILSRLRCEVAHCHNAGATIISAPIARATGSRVVVSTRHGLVAPGPRVAQEVKYWSVVRLFCDAVVAVCSAARQNLQAGPLADAGKVLRVYNGAEPAPTSARQVNRIPGEFHLLNVGRLTEVKDHRTLLRATRLALEKVPNLRLTIVGDGALAGELEREAASLGVSGRVEFVGERRDVGSWFQRSDLFALSSISEGLPVSLLEAMAAGVPQVVTDVGGMPEVVAASQSGRVVPPRSPEALAAAIVAMASSPGELRRMGELGKACYNEQFTLERMAVEYEGVYQSRTAAAA